MGDLVGRRMDWVVKREEDGIYNGDNAEEEGGVVSSKKGAGPSLSAYFVAGGGRASEQASGRDVFPCRCGRVPFAGGVSS